MKSLGHIAIVLLIVGVWSLFLGVDLHAEDAEKGKTAQGQSAKQSAAKSASKDAEDVLAEMLRKRRKRPTISPVRDPVIEAGQMATPVQSSQADVDTSVLGPAPGMSKPMLRREGEFTALRRGRLVRTPNSANQMMFVFEVDSRLSPEAPMVLMPCQTLESMERIIAERGDKIVFELSGQVFIYRGTNYLLPLVMNVPPDRGNLDN